MQVQSHTHKCLVKGFCTKSSLKVNTSVFSTSDPDDYVKSKLAFRFSAPLPARSVMCNTITIIDDDVVEPCEDFVVKIISPSKRAVIVSDSRSIVQINDDEGN